MDEHSLENYQRAPAASLEPKDFIEIVRDNRMRLHRLVIALMICGTVISAMGILLVAISDDAASSNVKILGILEVTTGSVGIAAIALGVGLIAYGLKTIMSKWT